METNAALLTRINHISGEHGRDIGHSGHGLGTDIDIFHFWPVISGANQDPSGGAVYDTLKRDALIALRSRLGSDRTGRGFAWLYDYDAGSMDVLARAGHQPIGMSGKP
jgi:hypothetical protein